MSEPRSPIAVGYVLKRYPRFSETFVVNEILEHGQHQVAVGDDRPGVLGQPGDPDPGPLGRQGAGAVVDQGDEVGLPRAPRPHQESVVRAPSAAQLLDPLHELVQKRLADHEELLQVLRRHGRGGEARGPHEAASQIRRRRAQVHWSAG